MPSLTADIQLALARAADELSHADGLLIAAGAGMGVDSGLPDFRGNTGLWRAYPALGHARVDFTEVANPQMFADDPRLAWGFYGHRLALYRATKPHTGFGQLKDLGKTLRFGSFASTSNVDGHFLAAAFAESHVHERHGSIHWWQCTKPCTNDLWPAAPATPDINVETCRWLGPLPQCPHCGALARPNILMFNDAHWVSTRTDLAGGRLSGWLNRVRRPVVVEIGAGVHVPSVRRFSEFLVQSRGAFLVRINPGDPEVPEGRAVGFATGALEGIRLLTAARSSALGPNRSAS